MNKFTFIAKNFIDYPVLKYFTLIATIFLMFGCTAQVNENIERGSTNTYRVGYPEVKLTAIGFFDVQQQPGINVTAEIVKGSLVYKHIGDTLAAQVGAAIKIRHSESNKTVKKETLNFKITSENNRITNSQESFVVQKRLPVSPGNYDVFVTVVDKSSGKQITQNTQTSIPEPAAERPHLTDIHLLSKNIEGRVPAFVPVSTYDIPGRNDSLSFQFQVTNAEDDTLEVNTELFRFNADTSIARKMSDPDYSTATIEWDGIEYDERTSLQKNSRLIIQPRNVLIEFKIPTPERGNYRFKATISPKNSSAGEDPLFKARDFSIKSQNFPTPQSPRELARPLAYLMGEKEHKELMSIRAPDSLKKAVDKFWLSEIKNPQTARDVIAKYYERVELANKQFSNFKEGWKTDMGMIFILFGSPWYTDKHVDEIQWSYSYDREQFESNYFFTQPTNKNKYFPFEHWILERETEYFTIEFRQRKNWKSGDILTQPLPF